MSEPVDETRVGELVDLLCERSQAERTAWFAENDVPPDLRAEVELVLRHFDALLIDTDALPDPEWSEPGDETALPASIGDYEVVGRLGQGGMGVVYRGIQSDPRRDVAIKVLAGIRLGSEAEQRFEREAQLLARLQHPGVAQVIEMGRTDGGEPFLVLEFIDGLTLTRHADERGLDRDARLALLADLADAVHHAHLRGVVHRDLKPSNVLVTDAGQVKVIDFGVARALDDEGLATLETRAGQVIGTLAYMAPEQMRGNPAAVDARADVYAMGVLAYEVLGRRLPLDLTTASVAQAARLLEEADPPPLGRVAKECRGDVEAIVHTALEKDPARRYASAWDLAADLRRCLAREPVLARPPSLVYQLTRLAQRHKGAFAGSAATILAIVVGAVVAVDQALENRALALKEIAARKDAEDAQAEAEDARQQAVDAQAEAEGARARAEDARAEAEGARARAEDAQAEAELARAAEAQRVKELESVVRFQANRIGFQSLPALAAVLEAALVDRIGSSIRVSGADPAAVSARVDLLRGLLDEADLPTVVKDLLWEGIFAPSADTIRSDFADQPAIRGGLLGELASLGSQLGYGEASSPLAREAVELLEEAHGPEDLRTVKARAIYLLTTPFGEELALAEQHLPVVLEAFGTSSSEALRFRIILADQVQAEDPARAEEILVAAIDDGNRGDARARRDIPMAQRRLGLLMLMRGAAAEASEHLEAAYESTRHRIAAGDKDALIVAREYGAALVALGRLEEAFDVLEAVHAGFVTHWGRDSPATLKTLYYLGAAAADLERNEEALPLLRELVEYSRGKPWEDPIQTVETMGRIGQVLAQMDRLDESRELLENLDAQIAPMMPPDRYPRNGIIILLDAVYRILDEQRPGEGWGDKADALELVGPDI